LSFGELRSFLLEACDPGADGSGWLAADLEDNATSAPFPIGRIGGEDLLFKNGYLICPWLGVGFNKKSLALVSRLFHELGCRIYEPGDGVFYEPEQLRSLEEEFYRLQALSSTS